MTIYRCIAPNWLLEEQSDLKKVVEGELTDSETLRLNEIGYNIYFLPNRPSLYEGGVVSGFQIDKFDYIFIDMDLKDKIYQSKQEFIEKLLEFPLLATMIVDSGNGIHAYWKLSDLNALNYLKLSRRLMRYFKTDEAVGQIYQLMRYPDTINTKNRNDFKICQHILEPETETIYTCEQLDKILPPITFTDIQYSEQHYNKTYNKDDKTNFIDDKIPIKFASLLSANKEVADIWRGNRDDRSSGDFRLGHIMFASNFSRDEALSVLINSAKALGRAPIHRISYAENIVDKIWTFEVEKKSNDLSYSVKEILSKSESNVSGNRFPCWSYFDNTEQGFRLGQVIGLVAGSGVGKTAIALNMFKGFVHNNPDYIHFFVPLEQPAHEIAIRWQTMCKGLDYLYDKVQVISNYRENGEFRHLSLTEIKDYIISFQEKTGKKVGCVVIDHIGALKKKGKEGENQGLMDVCHEMKAFAVQTNTMLIMQSQAPREKAGIGDLELNKDAAYGTVYFESYCDYLITLWQPLKRCYAEGAPTVSAYKFCKIRHKKQGLDLLQEDVAYKLMFDPKIEELRTLTQDEEKSFTFFLSKATNKRKQDRKTDLIEYQSIKI